MPFMENGEFKLYYEDTGGDLPVILFLHGAGGNHLSWWQQVPVFRTEYRCITVDQRGFGQSPDIVKTRVFIILHRMDLRYRQFL